MSQNSSKSSLWALLAWCLGVLGMIGIWMTLSVWLDKACLWMAVLSAIDIGLILRFTGVGPGFSRFFGIVIGTILITFASLWLVAANAFGLVMGLLPHESAQMVGKVLVWEFTRLRFFAGDWLWLLITFVIALWIGFRNGHTSPNGWLQSRHFV